MKGAAAAAPPGTESKEYKKRVRKTSNHKVSLQIEAKRGKGAGRYERAIFGW